jgi:NADH-quinone oxidoreductase subunit J
MIIGVVMALAALLVLGGVGVVALGVVDAAGDAGSMVLFAVLAFLLLAAALGVILERSPIRSALALIVALFLLAVMFVTLDAPLIAALQIIVYAGAIMVLFLFVIMLLNLQQDPRAMARLGTVTGSVVAGTLFLLAAVRFFISGRGGEMLATRLPGPGMGSAVPPDFGTIETVGERLFTHFLFAFELTSLVLLVGIVGAVVLAKRTWA